MEFLMTYGWAILVVLIAIGALMYFIKPTEMMGEKCTLPTGSGLFCEKWGASAGQLDLKIKNVLDETITVVAAKKFGGTNKAVAFDQIDNAPEEKERGGTSRISQKETGRAPRPGCRTL